MKPRRIRKTSFTAAAGAALALGLLLAMLSACSSTPEPASAVYAGAGHGQTLGEAMSAAKMDAVRSAVVDLIGAENEAVYAAELDEVLYSTTNPNAYVFDETMLTTRKDGSLIEGDIHYELTIEVNVEAVRRTLAANDIPRASGTAGPDGAPADAGVGTSESAQPVESTSQATGSGESPVDLSPADGDWGAVTPDEERFIRRYVETMTYMVYFTDAAATGVNDPSYLMRSAVNQANSYLVSDGRLVVDANQVERLKQDQELVYEEETGREISLLQWVARRLNADVYIELNARVSGSTNAGNHYGTADVTINMYDTSTGQILGSVNRRSQNAFSRTSQEDAILNAVQSTVYQAMPTVVDMARDQMARTLTRGIRYEVTIQNPPDARSLSRFRSAVRDEVREIGTVSQSPDEVVFEVFAIGSTDDMVDLVFEVSDRVAGFEDLILVISRGRALTFDAGF